MYQRPSYQNNSYGSSQGNPGDSSGGRGGRGGRGSRGGGGRGRGRGFTPEQLTQVNFDYQKISTSPALGGNGHHSPNTFPQRPYEHHNSYNNSNNFRSGPTHQTSQPPRRGYPPRAPYGGSSPAQNAQGFNSGNASAYVPPHLRKKVTSTPTFSAPITPRGLSNPRFLIPIKFVKGTGADEQAVKKLEEAQMRVRKAPVVTEQVQNTPPQPVLRDHTPVMVDKIEPENHASTEMHFDLQQELVPSPSVESMERPGLDPIDQLAQNALLAIADPSSLTLNSSTDMSKTNDQTIEQPEPSTSLPKVIPVNTSLGMSPTHPSTPSELSADVLAPSQITKTMIDVSVPLETQTSIDPAVLIASLKVSEPLTSTRTQTEPSALASHTSPAIPFADPKPAEKESLTFVVDCEGDPDLVSNLPPLAPRTKTFYQPLHEPVVAPTLATAEKPTGVRPSESGWTSSGQPVSVSHLSRSILDPVVAPAAPVPQPMADVIPSSELTGEARKARKAIWEQRRIQSEPDERVRITSLESGGPGPGQVPREGDSDIEWGSDGPPGEQLSGPKKEAMKKQRSRKEQEEMAILEDYVQNTASLSDSDEEKGGEGVGAEADAKRMRSFLNSVSESGSKHKTIDELEDDDVMAEEAEHLAKGGWKSDSDDSEDSFEEYGLDCDDEDEVDGRRWQVTEEY
ncbi:hypothetical protein CROQUDRAFT_330885 [Cronartium quercuum f. sp. fusiforme G11]|uniref:Uncharacterized protein n=1 Tax=Cronartium quercuum f. sp. fusiforme G11 TaxID=708437 RepID=A0A9P6TEI1_9BASI|nr:hypothetical protein CROQUDRAFT_330885 [Cronartium quercuum f. sp. fusiforme G11]